MTRPAWLDAAMDDACSQVTEIPGAGTHPRIREMFAVCGRPDAEDDATAWCAAAMCAWLEQGGATSPRMLTARSFMTWGVEEPVGAPRIGSVAVLWRVHPGGWQGHVGLYLGRTASKLFLVGGNQGNAVTVRDYPAGQLLGFRWPQ